jgi:D-alanine-D-alanine ligase
MAYLYFRKRRYELIKSGYFYTHKGTLIMRTIAIIAGGDSPEYMVSIKSAEAVAEPLKSKYITYTIIIKGPNWYYEGSGGKTFRVDKNDFSLETEDGKIRFDAVFIAIHGTPGENGLIQGYLEMLGIPYSSCGSLCSAITFSKQTCKTFLSQFGIKMAGSVMVRKGEVFDPREIVSRIGIPCFVKPDDSGSSFGVTKVKDPALLEEALEIAFRESGTALVETEMKGREVACGIVRTHDKEIVFPVTEIVSSNEFFDYEAKYTPGMSDEITPAQLPDQLTKEIQRITSDIYGHLGCRGIVRVDFIIMGEEPFFLEINTVPGMTPESLLPKQASAYGIEAADLYSMVIEDLFR